MIRKINFCFVFLLIFVFLTIPLTQAVASSYSPYVVVKEFGSEILVSDGSSYYIIDYGWGCYSSDFSEGEIIYIDDFLYPSYGDDILVESLFDYNTCSVIDADEVNLKDYFVHQVFDSDDKIMVEDSYGDLYLVEYGIGCLSMWRYEDKYIQIDIGGGYLDAISDRIYLFDSDDDCSVWDVDELDSSSGYSYSYDAMCKFSYGQHSYAIGSSCYCETGYTWSDDSSQCVPVTLTCPANSSWDLDQCVCDEGYIQRNSQCVTYDENCQMTFGEYSWGNQDYCYCEAGYQWNEQKTQCVEIPETTEPPLDESSEDGSTGSQDSDIVDMEESLVGNIDSSLVGRLKGQILLQVEEHGEAWYIDPVSEKKYYLKDGPVAYEALRKFGLGITDADLNKIPVGIEERFEDIDSDDDGLADKLEEGLKTDPNDADTDGDGVSDADEILVNGTNPLGSGSLAYSNSLVSSLTGRILLQVESRGEAWYLNPADGKRYYMKDGVAAYQIMRFLSLGVTNADLRKIGVGKIEN